MTCRTRTSWTEVGEAEVRPANGVSHLRQSRHMEPHEHDATANRK